MKIRLSSSHSAEMCGLDGRYAHAVQRIVHVRDQIQPWGNPTADTATNISDALKAEGFPVAPDTVQDPAGVVRVWRPRNRQLCVYRGGDTPVRFGRHSRKLKAKPMEEKEAPNVVTSVWQYGHAEEVSRVQEHQPPPPATNLATCEQRFINAGRLFWGDRGPKR